MFRTITTISTKIVTIVTTSIMTIIPHRTPHRMLYWGDHRPLYISAMVFAGTMYILAMTMVVYTSVKAYNHSKFISHYEFELGQHIFHILKIYLL